MQPWNLFIKPVNDPHQSKTRMTDRGSQGTVLLNTPFAIQWFQGFTTGKTSPLI